MTKLTLSAAVALVLIVSPALARDDQVAQAQLLLKMTGHDAGAIDGSYGGKTRQAFDAFYSVRGESYDGTLSANEFDDLYEALDAMPLNGVEPDWLSTGTGRTTYSADYDFVPSDDLAAQLPELTSVSTDGLAEKVAALPSAIANGVCRYNDADGFPAPGRLQTYPSMKAFEAAGRTPHPGNRWLEDVSFAMQRAGAGIATPGAAADMKRALLSYAEAGLGLDSANLMNSAGKIIVTPDFGTGVMVTTSILANYLIARAQLDLNEEERAKIERWLNRLYETFPDSYLLLNGEGSARDPRAVDLIGRAMMLSGALNGDAARFSEGARLVATVMSFVREDGSDRFGASRGNRALYYQGVALHSAMENLIIFNAFMPGAFDVLRPAADKLASFYGMAWNDHSVLFPYAKENNSVVPGSNYREQEEREPSEGLDAYLPIASSMESFAALMKIRSNVEFERQFGQTFNETCLGMTLPDAKVPEIVPENVPELSLRSSRVEREEVWDDGAGYRVSLRAELIDDQEIEIPDLDILLNWPQGQPEKMDLFRLTFVAEDQLDAQTQEADFSSCDDTTWARRDDGSIVFRVLLGFETEHNQCIFDKLGPNDRRTAEAVYYGFDKIIAGLLESEEAGRLREAYARLP